MRRETFAQRLARLREAAGLSGAQLAERAGLTRMQLWRLENGRQQPTLETARRLAEALGHKLRAWE